MSAEIRGRLLKYVLVFVIVWGLDCIFFVPFAVFATPPRTSEAIYVFMINCVWK